jgi:hypothetical protein
LLCKKEEEIMTTTFSSKSILAVSLVFIMSIMSSTAGAWVSDTSTSQTGCTKKEILSGQCSIFAEGLLKGLGNTTNDPTAFSVTIRIEAATFVLRNPASNNKQAQGTPFQDLAIILQGADFLDESQIRRNGRATAGVIFHDDVLVPPVLAAIIARCNPDDPSPESQDACEVKAQIEQHPNWLQTVVVTMLQVLGIQYVDDDPTTVDCVITTTAGPDGELGTEDDITTIEGDCRVEDALGQMCDAPADVLADPTDFAWEAFDYDCTQVCHDREGNICPDELPI